MIERVILVTVGDCTMSRNFASPVGAATLRVSGRVAATLRAFLLAAASCSAPASEAKPLTSILIVAGADLPDPNFADSVVLVMNNLGPAPIGFIVNRPTQIAVSRLFPDIKRLQQVQDKVYFGGPVDFGSVWYLFRASKMPEHAVQALEGVYLSANRDLLLQLLSRSEPTEGLRIFVGYSAWAPGQLEGEIKNGTWKLQSADSDAIFDGKSEHPWPAPPTPKGSI
jgi:putative transcriptional regulator